MNNDRPVRLGIIGCGSWAMAVAEAIKRSKKTELITCFDIITGNSINLSKKYTCDHEASLEDLLTRNDIEAVIVTSPNAVHAQHAVLSAQQGKHVFVEKPIANTLADGKKMVSACEKSGVVLMVGHYARRFAGMRQAKELLDEGKLGRPIMIEGNMSTNNGFALTPDKFRWRDDDSGCPSGPLMTQGVHLADVFNHFFGPIETAFSYFNKLYIAAEVPDVTMTIFQFRSGVLGYLGSNYVAPNTFWLYIYGTEANLLCTIPMPQAPSFDEYLKLVPLMDDNTNLQLMEKGKTEPRNIPVVIGDPMLEEIDEFAHCLRTGERPETDGPGALEALALIRAAIESVQTGQPVKVAV
ncbi:MAG: Gfo/Idh/MocA family oxidoreductase [Pseudomonadota bacterium]